ncbi:hypothetical protein LOZ80_14940 [Paenibacillus sp. HWE-109]|uniref:hypothetical protein n=1 Tax=Paenibacillus sp. HWE-109 TaxID=1306526 RepID=UPI001EE11103|nr:hypothetical protein [Paenibacillus sp. HWE-109]UKS30157.1 hypothetical protein LOZ80_14940 [Paenibacillus sp. HWE-109]
MALIPLKQRITVDRAGSLDSWGVPVTGETVEIKARVTEMTKTVVNRYGEEATTTLVIYVDKYADFSYDDTITYTNEYGVTVARKPLKIDVKRMLSGKPVLTEVYV